MLHISKEQIDSVKMEIRGRRAMKQQAAFSFRFRRRRQSRDTQAGCHLLFPGVSLSPGPDFRPVGRLRPTGGEDKHLPVIPCTTPQWVKVPPSKLNAKASRQPGAPALLRGTAATATPTSHCPRRAPLLLTIQTCTVPIFFHTYKQMETSKRDGYLTSKYF